MKHDTKQAMWIQLYSVIFCSFSEIISKVSKYFRNLGSNLFSSKNFYNIETSRLNFSYNIAVSIFTKRSSMFSIDSLTNQFLRVFCPTVRWSYSEIRPISF